MDFLQNDPDERTTKPKYRVDIYKADAANRREGKAQDEAAHDQDNTKEQERAGEQERTQQPSMQDGKIMGKIFEAWIGNIRAYAAENLRGEWIDFPSAPEELERALARIGGEEQAAFDFKFPENYEFLRDVLGEDTPPQDMNMLGYALQGLEGEELEAVAAYAQSHEMDTREILNAIAQMEDIPYHRYNFKGIENGPGMDREEKYGYTMVENNMQDLAFLLEQYHMAEADSLDYQAIGHNAILSGEVFLGETGYLDLKVEGPDLNLYSIEKLREMFKESIAEDAEIDALIKRVEEQLKCSYEIDKLRDEIYKLSGEEYKRAEEELERLYEKLDRFHEENKRAMEELKMSSERQIKGPKL